MKAAGELENCPNKSLMKYVTVEAVTRWTEEEEDTRDEYENRAKKARDDASAAGPAPLQRSLRASASQVEEDRIVPEEGPLNMASLNGPYPVVPELVERYQDEHNFTKSVERFMKNADSTQILLRGSLIKSMRNALAWAGAVDAAKTYSK